MGDGGYIGDYDYDYTVLPVVSLKSGINMTWDATANENDGAWILSE